MAAPTRRVVIHLRRGSKEAAGKLGWFLYGLVSFAIKAAASIVLIVACSGLIFALLFSIYVDRYLPADQVRIDLAEFDMNLTTHIHAIDPDTGEWIELTWLSAGENRIRLKYEDIPRDVINAVVAIEDRRFWHHNGVDWRRTGGAFQAMFLGGDSSYGGSTLTQQLIKNITDYDEVTIQRKLIEIFSALEFERNYNKETIVEWYLNYVYMGQGAYGIGAAASVYFGKDVDELTVAEIASIIGITNNPSLYDPYLNPLNNKRRQETILSEMYKQGYLDQAQYVAAMNQNLVLTRGRPRTTADGETVTSASVWSYYVDHVIRDVITDLAAQNNWTRRFAETMLYTQGYNIYTNVDLRIQGMVDDVFDHFENYPDVRGSDFPQAAIAIICNETGRLVAIHGGHGKEGRLTFNRATQALRHPGSAIKPLTVYAPALEYGVIKPNSVLEDVPASFNPETERFFPRNLGTEVYEGRITFARAMNRSNNAAAVYVTQLLTPELAFYFARDRLGMNSLIESRIIGGQGFTDIDVAPMALGGLTLGCTVLEMAAAYAVFPNRGVYRKPASYSRVSRVVDGVERVELDNTRGSSVAMREETAFYMNHSLMGVVSGPGGTANPRAQFPQGHNGRGTIQIAGKTGTSQSDKDRYFVGYTPYYTAAVWFGFDTPMEVRLTEANNPALTMWRQVMWPLHEDLPPAGFFTLPGAAPITVCVESGMPTGPNCRHDPRWGNTQLRPADTVNVVLLPEDVPAGVCTLHVMVEIDRNTGGLATPWCPGWALDRIALVDHPRVFNNFERAPSIADAQYMVRRYGMPDPPVRNPETGEYDEVPWKYSNRPANAVNNFCYWCPENRQPSMQNPAPNPSPTPNPGGWPWDPGSAASPTPDPALPPTPYPTPTPTPIPLPTPFNPGGYNPGLTP